MVTDRQANVLRDLQAGVARQVREELDQFFGSLNLDKPEAVREALLQYVPLLVRSYGQGAASVAADWYDEVRAGANVRGRFRAQVADSVEQFRIERTVRFAAQYLFTGAAALALPSLLAPVERYVVEPSRLTIVGATTRDPRASGWYRKTRSDGCDFCRKLAGKGVYKYDGDFAAHNDCGCVAVPSWDPDAPEVDVRAYEASRYTGGMTPAQKADHNAKIRDWIASA
ncbi:hypothetical protein NB037_03130 [Rathayibacter sp. ZW T2_19]|uniref:Uncharacterized protein n=1 Tax=Rathayibacter rubneri TaxID=2950106 RepID=A0A9X2DYH8_9MICO|nr:hypothetical protein [Rathayibacter rubneri]MCM6761401.1 hypothetical protein [Rathayibacter rubneri]